MSKTALIIGAGANKEIHPDIDLGAELIENISNRVTDHNVRDKNLSNLLNKLGFASSLREEFKYHLDNYRRAVPNPSIDSFLYEVGVHPEFSHHREEFLKIGRILIVSHVRGFEGTTSVNNIDEELAQAKLGNISMWLSFLGDYIEENDCISRGNFCIVTFNYDRLVEYYLYMRFPGEKIEGFIKENVIHVYGNVCGEQRRISTFDLANDNPGIVQYIDNIKLLTDRKEQDKQVEGAVLGADKILIMGYGLDPLNNRRLQLQRINSGEQQLIFNGHPGVAYDFAPRRIMAATVRDLVVDAEICHYSSCKEFIYRRLLQRK